MTDNTQKKPVEEQKEVDSTNAAEAPSPFNLDRLRMLSSSHTMHPPNSVVSALSGGGCRNGSSI